MILSINPPFTTRLSRLILFFLVLIAGISLVTSTILRNRAIAETTLGEVTVAQLKNALILSILTSMHILYMLIVVNINVLKDIRFPKSRSDIFKRYLTIALCLAYAAPLLVYLVGTISVRTSGHSGSSYLSFGPTSGTSKVSALVLFLVVYSLWLYCEVVEYSESRRNTHLARPHILNTIKTWIAIEASSIITILTGIAVTLWYDTPECAALSDRNACLWFFQTRDIFGNQVSLVEWKDTFVGACLVFFLVRTVHHNSSPQTEIYPTWYASYVDAIVFKAADHNFAIDQMSSLKEELLRGRILDFGCGDGKRLEQLLSYVFGLTETQRKAMRIDGLDPNAAWKSRFVFGENSFMVALSGDDAKYDVFHLSHVLYEPSSTLAAIDTIRSSAVDGALICVRGASANSPTYLLSVALASKMLGYHPHHHWIELHLHRLVRACNLSPMIGEKRDFQNNHFHPVLHPNITVKQTISVRNEDTLSAVLGAIFADESRVFSSEVISSIRAARVTEVPVDDNVYIFRYSKSPTTAKRTSDKVRR